MKPECRKKLRNDYENLGLIFFEYRVSVAMVESSNENTNRKIRANMDEWRKMVKSVDERVSDHCAKASENT